jgi:hypothetical protein
MIDLFDSEWMLEAAKKRLSKFPYGDVMLGLLGPFRSEKKLLCILAYISSVSSAFVK